MALFVVTIAPMCARAMLQEKHEVTQSVLQGQNHTLGRAEAELEELRRYQDTHGDKAHAAEARDLFLYVQKAKLLHHRISFQFFRRSVPSLANR